MNFSVTQLVRVLLLLQVLWIVVTNRRTFSELTSYVKKNLCHRLKLHPNFQSVALLSFYLDPPHEIFLFWSPFSSPKWLKIKLEWSNHVIDAEKTYF